MASQLTTRQAQNLVRRMLTRKGNEGWMDEENVLYEIADLLDCDEGDIETDTYEQVNELLDRAVTIVRFPNTRTRRTHR